MLFLLIVSTACSNLTNRIDDLESRISILETLAEASKNGDMISSVTPIIQGDTIIGYVISFMKGSPITVYCGKDGKDGKDGDSYFQNIIISEKDVTFITSDNQSFVIKRQSEISITIDSADRIVVAPNSDLNLRYAVTSCLSAITIEVISSGNVKGKVISDDASNKTGVISIRVGSVIDEYDKLVVIASDGIAVTMKRIEFEEEIIEVIDNTEKEIGSEGGNIELEFLSNIKCEVSIPESAQSWISVTPESKTIEKQRIALLIQPNTGKSRSASVSISNKDGSIGYSFIIKQKATLDYQLSIEREALFAIYNSFGGKNWKKNDSWFTDKPLSQWYGIITDEEGFVTGLHFYNDYSIKGSLPFEESKLSKLKTINFAQCGVSGTLPDCFEYLKELKELNFRRCNLSGNIPSSIGSLTKLTKLNLSGNNLIGTVPNSFSNLKRLENLDLSYNKLAGSFPSGLISLPKLSFCKICNNNFTGSLPPAITNSLFWEKSWGYILWCNFFSIDGLKIEAPSFTVTDVYGKELDSETEYKKHKYTVMCMFDVNYFKNYQTNEYAVNHIKKINEVCAKYEDVGFILWFPGIVINNTDKSAAEVINNNSLQCRSFVATLENTFDICKDHDFYYGESGGSEGAFYPADAFSTDFIVDENGFIVWTGSDFIHRNYLHFDDFLSQMIDNVPIPSQYYTSTDYSKDGRVHMVQKSDEGNGISIVFMGDGFSDRLIADGTYENHMKDAVDAFFMEEPFKSYRHLFNVFVIDVVSENEIICDLEYDTSTALGVGFGEGSYISGSDGLCFSYALNAVSEKQLDNTLIIVLANSNKYAGTCFLYQNYTGNYGVGAAVAYLTLGSDKDIMMRTLHHEACGHGFAKLADEYYYSGTRPNEDDIIGYQGDHRFGWYMNLDFTLDKDKIIWSNFIRDSRYSDERIGIYEGAIFEFGAYKPTKNSIMYKNTGGFNAPSRYAIWYRINKLAYGEEWNGDYEDFVKYDKDHRTTVTANSCPKAITFSSEEELPPFPSPIVKKHSWKKELNHVNRRKEIK